MSKRTVKKILLWTGGSVLFLSLVLIVHIYMVTRPRTDEKTRIMARIDIKEKLSAAEAHEITDWLFVQKGVDHVVFNPGASMLLFTYSPLKNNADQITSQLNSKFDVSANRYKPSDKEMASGCPAAATSATYKIYSFVKHVF